MTASKPRKKEKEKAPPLPPLPVGVPTNRDENTTLPVGVPTNRNNADSVPTNRNENAPDAIMDQNLSLKAENQLLKLQIQALEEKITDLSATKVPGKAQSNAGGQPFEVGGRVYKLKQSEINIRKVGRRTELDIASDDEGYSQLGGLSIKEWLVANNSTAIEEIANAKT